MPRYQETTSWSRRLDSPDILGLKNNDINKLPGELGNLRALLDFGYQKVWGLERNINWDPKACKTEALLNVKEQKKLVGW